MKGLEVRNEPFHRPKLEVIATNYGKCRDHWLSWCLKVRSWVQDSFSMSAFLVLYFFRTFISQGILSSILSQHFLLFNPQVNNKWYNTHVLALIPILPNMALDMYNVGSVCVHVLHAVGVRCLTMFWFTVHTRLNLGCVNNSRIHYVYRVFEMVKTD